jgi:hypothetical protein
VLRDISLIQLEWHFEEERGWVDDAEVLYAKTADRDPQVQGSAPELAGAGHRSETDGDPGNLDTGQTTVSDRDV